MMNKLLVFIVLSLMPLCINAASDKEVDSIFVERLLASGHTDVLWFAKQFIGRPYVAHTLEINREETLVVNTREVDCTTFVENVLALTMCSRRGERCFSDFKHQLMQLRYRKGVINAYPSRLHYFSDWIIDNESMGYVTEIQKPTSLFSGLQTVSVHWMSTHPGSYRALRENPDFSDVIKQQEQKLTGKQCRFIPTRNVVNNKLMREIVHDGDVIATVSTKNGLDIAHLGFAIWKNGVLCFLDASSIHKKVVVEPTSLRQYLTKRKQVCGFRLIRLK